MGFIKQASKINNNQDKEVVLARPSCSCLQCATRAPTLTSQKRMVHLIVHQMCFVCSFLYFDLTLYGITFLGYGCRGISMATIEMCHCVDPLTNELMPNHEPS